MPVKISNTEQRRYNLFAYLTRVRPKTILRKIFETDFKKMELSWGMAEWRSAKEKYHGDKRVAALSLMHRFKEKLRRIQSSNILPLPRTCNGAVITYYIIQGLFLQCYA